jgi:hypothetical protein
VLQPVAVGSRPLTYQTDIVVDDGAELAAR